LGLIFQSGELLPELTALENVSLPGWIAGRSRTDVAQRATALLNEVGLGERLGAFLHELSGGQIQRVAVARALINSPALLLADEPTASLDADTAMNVIDSLVEQCHRYATSSLVATHDHNVAARLDRTLVLSKGQLIESTA
jgi:lipoprotein-releasing system ATP-binding protein